MLVSCGRLGRVLGSLSLCLVVAGGARAWADAVLLVEDPVNFAGRFTSAGHSAVWLDRLCSDDHVSLRSCRTGEAGTVLSRYPALNGGYDWLAMPVGAYLFAVDREDEIPSGISREQFERMQKRYRDEHQASFTVAQPDKVWLELTGESYRRRIVLLRVHTSEEQDLSLMKMLNERPNVSHYNLFRSNCSDFSGIVLGRLFPGGFHRSYLLDVGMMTPKENASNLHRYAQRHKGLDWEAGVLPQLPGEMPRSGHVRGVTEAYLKSWWFMLPVDVLDPFELGAVTVLGVADRRYVGKGAARVELGEFFGPAITAATGRDSSLADFF